MKKALPIIVGVAALVLLWTRFSAPEAQVADEPPENSAIARARREMTLPPPLPPSEQPAPPSSVPDEVAEGEAARQSVPFTSQAPAGQWSNPRYQDACEETSVLMALAWLEGDTRQSIPAGEAAERITALSHRAETMFGTYVDSSTADTLKLLRDAKPDVNATLVNNATEAQLITALQQGAVVVAAMNGQALGNPNFTSPGPINHMLVVIGYDPETDQFITNDPGTRSGRGYRYGTATFMAAIRDYPTGDHLPHAATPKKAAIIIYK